MNDLTKVFKQIKEETSYQLGEENAYDTILRLCLSRLPAVYSPPGIPWELERQETIARLRSLCVQLDIDASWPDDLYLPDIIEKLEDYLLS